MSDLEIRRLERALREGDRMALAPLLGALRRTGTLPPIAEALGLVEGSGPPALSEVMRWFSKHPHRVLYKGFKDLAVRWAWWTRPSKRCDLRRHLDDLRRDIAISPDDDFEAPRVLYVASNIVRWSLKNGHGYLNRDMILAVLDWSISCGHSPYVGPADRYLKALSILPPHTQALFVDMCRDMALTKMGLPLDPDIRGDDDPPVGKTPGPHSHARPDWTTF